MGEKKKSQIGNHLKTVPWRRTHRYFLLLCVVKRTKAIACSPFMQQLPVGQKAKHSAAEGGMGAQNGLGANIGVLVRAQWFWGHVDRKYTCSKSVVGYLGSQEEARSHRAQVSLLFAGREMGLLISFWPLTRTTFPAPHWPASP